jgi:large subunit ribosomal protein L2
MGKRLRLQRRGKGTPKYAATNHAKVKIRYNYFDHTQCLKGQVVKLFSDPIRTAPVAEILFENGSIDSVVACEGLKTGDRVVFGKDAALKHGNVLFLEHIEPGTSIFNIEKNFGDGGKFVRATGQSATLMTKKEDVAIVKMPSGKIVNFPLNVRATIGIVAGSGRTNKPFVKAGNKFHAMKAKSRPYPRLRGVAMNAVDHPFGGLQHHVGHSKSTSRHAPSGRKVGAVASKRTGRKKK